MKQNLFTDLNIDRAFRNEVNNLSEDKYLLWINNVFSPYTFSKYYEFMLTILTSFQDDLTNLLNELNQKIIEEVKYEKFFLLALKSLILSKENKVKIFDAMDYLTKYVYKYTKSADQMITERLRQYKLLLEIKGS